MPSGALGKAANYAPLLLHALPASMCSLRLLADCDEGL